MTASDIKLFQPFTLGGVELPNRIVVGPMCQYSAVNGVPNDWHMVHLGQFALGGAGLTLVEATGVNAEGRITPHDTGLWNDEQEKAFARIVAFHKENGVGSIGIQLAHAGRKAATRAPWVGGGPASVEEGAWPTVSASAVPFADGYGTPSALDAEGLARTREDFAEATRRAVRAGFAVIEMHAAHGYLMHQFLSPLSNRREDRYGGSLENRMRYPLEVFEAMRAAAPASVPVGVRLSATDFAEGGWSVEEAIAFSRELEARGAAYIHVSGGGLVPHARIPIAPGYQVGFARRIRAAVSIPVITVGLLTNPADAERVLQEGAADLVALARKFLEDPRWPQRAARELGVEVPLPKQYGYAISPRWQESAQAQWGEAAE
ncbi:NADH:flavin oxidoreductase/NADH oxidase [Azospirillum sp. SYSU D00513]|uniref:NADH:flavin oxidoreductase/NADH oxidase n=1 Tax=Azospirillum sp. SYSU D00513 TaxID=2812561 RepID=UPI001A968EB8|nr:NADH:flavin oxidoreductase/NADH oxidase [Azospirillum sp. SYSU D00513]